MDKNKKNVVMGVIAAVLMVAAAAAFFLRSGDSVRVDPEAAKAAEEAKKQQDAEAAAQPQADQPKPTFSRQAQPIGK
jgi:molybdopterin-guanine dinucleotide biosynthesis protein A